MFSPLLHLDLDFNFFALNAIDPKFTSYRLYSMGGQGGKSPPTFQ